jgi:hypothetical protein
MNCNLFKAIINLELEKLKHPAANIVLRIGFLFLFSSTTHAQSIRVYGFTPTITQITPLSKKIDWNFYIGNTINPVHKHFGSLDYPADDIRLQVNNTFFYKAKKNLSVGAGLLYQRNFPFDGRHTNEYRTYQQVILSHYAGTSKINHRIRFNERFIQNTTINKYPLTTTLQYTTSFLLPFKGKTVEPKTFYAIAYLDMYFFLQGPNKYSFFGEFWANASAGYNMGKWGKLQAGVQYEWLVRNAAKDKRRILNLETDWITSFDIFGVRKKK